MPLVLNQSMISDKVTKRGIMEYYFVKYYFKDVLLNLDNKHMNCTKSHIVYSASSQEKKTEKETRVRGEKKEKTEHLYIRVVV